jgi:hypothetical protein
MPDFLTREASTYSTMEADRPVPTASWADTATLDPRIWWVTPAAFWARMGAEGDAIAASTNATCMAVMAWVQARFASGYVDLKEAALVTRLNALTAASQPTGAAMDNTKRDAIVNTVTTDAERVVKGMQQPSA